MLGVLPHWLHGHYYPIFTLQNKAIIIIFLKISFRSALRHFSSRLDNRLKWHMFCLTLNEHGMNVTWCLSKLSVLTRYVLTKCLSVSSNMVCFDLLFI